MARTFAPDREREDHHSPPGRSWHSDTRLHFSLAGVCGRVTAHWGAARHHRGDGRPRRRADSNGTIWNMITTVTRLSARCPRFRMKSCGGAAKIFGRSDSRSRAVGVRLAAILMTLPCDMRQQPRLVYNADVSEAD